MSRESEESLTSDTPAATPRRRSVSIRSLLLLVACCGAILWSYRYLSENYDPVLVEARSIQRRSIIALRSGTKAERLGATQALTRLSKGNNAAAMPALTEALDDPDLEIRVAAAEALNWIAPAVARSQPDGDIVSETEAALIRCMKDPDVRLRLCAAETLGSIAETLLNAGSSGKRVEKAMRALIESLKDSEPGVRAVATANLGTLAAPRAGRTSISPSDRNALMKSIAASFRDRDARVRRAAISSLAGSPGRAGEPPALLIEGLKDESAENRLAAVRGLNLYRQGLDPWVPLLFQLLNDDPDPAIREECSNTLAYAFHPPAITPAVVPNLTTSLGSKSARVRSHAASFLGEFIADSRAAIPELIVVLNEPLDPEVVPIIGPGKLIFDPGCAAALALGRIAPGAAKEKEVIAALMEVARTGPVSRRGWAAIALGGFGPAAEEGVPVLIQVIEDAGNDGTFEREASAAIALGQIAPKTPSAEQAVKGLVPLLRSKHWLAQIKAIESLEKFGPEATPAIPGLRSLTNNRSERIKDAAVKALLAIENPSAP